MKTWYFVTVRYRFYLVAFIFSEKFTPTFGKKEENKPQYIAFLGKILKPLFQNFTE